MNDNARKWVEALRSGEFAQTIERLHRKGGGYCCLGVACEIYLRETGRGSWEQHPVDRASLQFRGAHALLPQTVREWLGLKHREGTFDGKDSLVVRNDTGSTFDQIADIIESEPEGLFQ